MTNKIFSGISFVISRSENVKELKGLLVKHGGDIYKSLRRGVDVFVQSYNIEDDGRLIEAYECDAQILPAVFLKDCIREGRLLDVNDHALGLSPWTTVLPSNKDRGALLQLFKAPSVDWREEEEQPQCFDEFSQMENRLKPTSKCRSISLVTLRLNHKISYCSPPPSKKSRPSPDVFDEFLSELVRYLGVFFDLPIRQLPCQQIHYSPTTNHYRFKLDSGAKQYRVEADKSTKSLEVMSLIEVLTDNIPRDSVCLIAVTDCAIYERGGGIGTLYGRATGDGGCVISACTEGHPYSTEHRLLLGVASHELMHCFGLDHCVYFGCIMNACCDPVKGSLLNPPLTLCPVCLRKIELALKIDVVRRYRALLKLYRKAGYDREVATINSVLKIIRESDI